MKADSRSGKPVWIYASSTELQYMKGQGYWFRFFYQNGFKRTRLTPKRRIKRTDTSAYPSNPLEKKWAKMRLKIHFPITPETGDLFSDF